MNRNHRVFGVALLVAASGCAKEVDDGFPITVNVKGVEAPVEIAASWDGVTQEILPAPTSGTFSTRAVLPAGVGVALTAPTNCHFDNGESMLALTTTESPTQAILACPGVLDLTQLGASLPVQQTYTDNNFSYQLTLGVLRINPSPALALSPMPAWVGATVKINNGSAPQNLSIGRNTIDVAFPAHDLSRSYQVMLSSATAEKEITGERVLSADPGTRLGSAVAADGDVVAVSVPGENSVWVMRRSDVGWTREAILTGDGGPAEFGASLALAGDTLAVGAPLNGANVTGAVYLFVRTGTNWAQLRRLEPLVRNSRFGAAVALSGSTGFVAVGAPGESAEEGAAYVYPRLGETAGQEARLLASNRGAGDRFGAAVAFAGDKLWVGAPFEDSSTTLPEGATDSGAVYRFVYANGTGTWSAEGAPLKSRPMPLPGGQYGALLAGSGDWMAASWKNGTSGAVDCLSANAGFRYTISTGGVVTALANAHSRVAVSLAGAGGARQVAAYRLVDAGSIGLAAPFSGPAGSSGFGAALTFAGDRLLVGAPTAGTQEHGALYTYE
jgi:FG-GAP repeat